MSFFLSYLVLDFSISTRCGTSTHTYTPTESSRTFMHCSANYGQNKLCKDPQRSLRYKHSRMLYKERNCPEEPLKCRALKLYRYQNRFPQPISGNLAWFANVPHHELTIEKVVQNQIQSNETTFSNSVDAHIEDIQKLINLIDGFIRNALDTGCEVGNLFLLRKYYYLLKFFPLHF